LKGCSLNVTLASAVIVAAELQLRENSAGLTAALASNLANSLRLTIGYLQMKLQMAGINCFTSKTPCEPHVWQLAPLAPSEIELS
jgi:hypothetical protein